MRIPVLLCVATLAGCSGPEPDATQHSEPAPSPAAAPSEAPPRAPAPAKVIASVERLAGEYRIAGVDGRDIDLPYGITASISGDRIEIQADCVRLAWSYRFAGPTIETGRVPVKSCRRALTAEEEALATAFDAATSVTLTPSNGYEFGGSGHSVTLFTQ